MISVDEWQPADGLILEPNAFIAVRERRNCLALTAGPGAGKTELLAQRANFLLQTGVCPYPKRILAISFKVDASKNLKERVHQRCKYELSSRFDSYTFHGFAKRIIDRFRLVLVGEDALDVGYKVGNKKISRSQIEFDDLIPLAIQILAKSTVAKNAVRQTYSDVFLDEFQDCTTRQYELLKIAFQNTSIRLTAVGDEKQKIMGWAGAMNGVFKDFAQDFAAIPLNMYLNFRSKPRLLRMQNEVIRVLDLKSAMPEDQIVGEDGEISLVHSQSEMDEAETLADTIFKWIKVDLIPPSEIAILISKQPDLYVKPLMSALKARGIHYRNEQQMQDISTEPIARLIVDYLSCLYGRREPKAWVRLMSRMDSYVYDGRQSESKKSIEILFLKQRKALGTNKQISTEGWWEFAREFLSQVGIEYVTSFSADYESTDRLKDVIRDTKMRIEELLISENDLLRALERFSDDQAVRILTFHKSKGLEFDSVIVMAIENEIFFGNPEENRCAFFVGVSRAKSRLILTCANQRSKPESWNKQWKVNRSMQIEYIGYIKPFI